MLRSKEQEAVKIRTKDRIKLNRKISELLQKKGSESH